ncbi:MAG: Flp family type IVb pilin [Alphaproteobacteria bacterium]|nr:Flp family type IVb pilin [Alphaproteobacteria bacterium]
MKRILHNFYSCCGDESGTSAVEYAFVAFLISTVAIVAITEIGGHVSGMYSSVNEGFKGNQ